MPFGASENEGLKPAKQQGGAFQNERVMPAFSLFKTLAIFWKLLFHKPANTRPADAIPVRRLTRLELETAAEYSVYRLGHSTMLLKLNGKFWLTDPVYAERASPFQWAGPKRFHAPPISLDSPGLMQNAVPAIARL